MNTSLDGKTVLVTGASSGLGRHFASMLAARGATVLLAARRMAALDEACAQIIAAGGKAETITLDVADEASITAAFAGFSTVPDIIINNAGISGEGPALDLDAAAFDRVMDTNLRGAFLVAKTAASAMRDASKGGSIVNIASILGHRVAGNVSAYAASKAGLVHLTKALALEWARYGVRVNALCPGYIETEINSDFFTSDVGQALIKRIPQRRLGKPEDLDGALLLLASDAGRYITGASLAVDGGHLVSSL